MKEDMAKVRAEDDTVGAKSLHLKQLTVNLLGGHLLTFLSIKAKFHVKEVAKIGGIAKDHRWILESFDILKAVNNRAPSSPQVAGIFETRASPPASSGGLAGPRLVLCV